MKTVTRTNSVRRLNLNQRRFGLASVIAVPHAAGGGQGITTKILNLFES